MYIVYYTYIYILCVRFQLTHNFNGAWIAMEAYESMLGKLRHPLAPQNISGFPEEKPLGSGWWKQDMSESPHRNSWCHPLSTACVYTHHPINTVYQILSNMCCWYVEIDFPTFLEVFPKWPHHHQNRAARLRLSSRCPSRQQETCFTFSKLPLEARKKNTIHSYPMKSCG